MCYNGDMKMEIKKAYNAIRSIDNINDLKRNKLTLAEYNDLCSAFNDLVERQEAETISERVAKWYKKQGFDVTEKGIGYKIS